jgi:hypothetical protein
VRKKALKVLLVACVCIAGTLLLFPELIRAPDTQTTILAISNPNDSQAAIIRSLRWHGNVNAAGVATDKDGAHVAYSLVAAAAHAHRREVLGWLLQHGANPNPPGANPLQESLRGEDTKGATMLLHAGAKWSARLRGGQTVREWAEANRPHLLSQLP